jgi:hypothetical protein
MHAGLEKGERREILAMARRFIHLDGTFVRLIAGPSEWSFRATRFGRTAVFENVISTKVGNRRSAMTKFARRLDAVEQVELGT